MRIIAADLETGSVGELHSADYRYVRLCGWKTVGSADPVHISTDPREMLEALASADAVTWTNGLNFDALALAKHESADYEALCYKSFDTMIVERHLNPVAAKGAQPAGYYGLDATAARYGVAGKSSVDFDGKREIVRRIKGDAVANKLKRGKTDEFGVLKLLADLYGGYHRIDQSDTDYRRYLEFDVLAQEGVFLKQWAEVQALPIDGQRYIRREHAVAAAMGRITLEGFRVDTDETMRRWSAGQARLDAGKNRLHDQYGMPLEGKFPHRSNPGKAAFRQALLDTGISGAALDANWPRGKDGSLLTGKEVLNGMIPLFDARKPEAAELCRIILAMNGERSVPGTLLDHLVGDRVHPFIGPEQGSGRWSMRNPGLTVLLKSGDERGLLLADNDDELLVAIDADQADGRIAAALSGDMDYAALFKPGVDLHSEVAWRVFGDPRCRAEMDRNNGRCDCPLRKSAKVAGFSWNYGGGIGTIMSLGVSEDDARRFDAGMKAAFPQLCRWKDQARRDAGAMQYGEEAPSDDSYRVLHTWAGRPVRVERNRAYTQAPAMLGQGGTRDMMAEALLRLDKRDRRRVRAVVHDEFVFSLPRDGAEERARDITERMRFELNGVEFTFGASKCAPDWSACYS